MRHILVIGAAGGVGSAVAAKLAERGDAISATVMDQAQAAQVREQLPDARAIQVLDLGDAEGARVELSRAVEAAGQIDAVVVCAAIAPIGPVESTPLATVRKTLEVNCISHVAVYQAVLPALRRSGGRLVFISSMAGRTGMPFIGAYTASKYALEGVADVMRREAAPQGVNIVLVEPGGVRTPMVEDQLRSNAATIERLSGEEDERYGYLYRGFQAMAAAGQRESSSTPEQIADVVIEALDATPPAARYIAGDDARQLIAMAESGSDEALDQAFAGMFGAAR